MGYWIGAGLALLVGLYGTLVGLDRERAFYPTVLCVVASLYVLFAVMGGSHQALALESIGTVAFVGAATVGFRRSLWLVVAGLAAHGVFDFVRGYLDGHLIANPGVPRWWPQFCGAYDVVAAAYLAALLSRARLRAAAERPVRSAAP